MSEERIAHLESMIRDLTEQNNTLRCQLAEERYYRHKHDLVYQHPFEFLFWRIFVWPFIRKEHQ